MKDMPQLKGMKSLGEMSNESFLNNLFELVGFVFIYLFFRVTPAAHGSSQARGQFGAAAASLHHSHSFFMIRRPPRSTP